MEKKLVKNGNSYGLLIEKALLKAMRFSVKTEFEILPYGSSLVIRKVERVASKSSKRSGRTKQMRGKKLLATGSSFMLIIDKPLRDLMGFTPETVLEVRQYGRAIMIRKKVVKLTKEEKAQKKLQEEYEESLKDPMLTILNL